MPIIWFALGIKGVITMGDDHCLHVTNFGNPLAPTLDFEERGRKRGSEVKEGLTVAGIQKIRIERIDLEIPPHPQSPFQPGVPMLGINGSQLCSARRPDLSLD